MLERRRVAGGVFLQRRILGKRKYTKNNVIIVIFVNGFMEREVIYFIYNLDIDIRCR